MFRLFEFDLIGRAGIEPALEAEPLPAHILHVSCLGVAVSPSQVHTRSCARADLRVLGDIVVMETVQYVRFPGGPPPEYWTRPWLLSFGDRTGSGGSNQV